MSKLQKGLMPVSGEEEDINPMDGVSNMVDAMLVLACGLMVALIVAWNISPTQFMKEVDRTNETDSVETVEDVEESLEQDGYQDMGKVYKDPKTGKLYIVTEE